MRDLFKDAPLIDRDMKKELPVGIELAISRSVVRCATT